MPSPTSSPHALQPTDLDPGRAQLSALELQLAQREVDLSGVKAELLRLQDRYLNEVGALYAKLSELEAAVAEAEIRTGVRSPREADDEFGDEPEPSDTPSVSGTGCSNRSAPSDDLKRVFRDVAKAIHPDLALDEPARCRRHSLMAEANRAYADRDEDRLRLILRAWERSPDAVAEDDPEADRLRVERRLAQIDERLVQIEAEFADLRASAIWRLKTKIDEARTQGWDLFAEMVMQVKSEIGRAQARLAVISVG